MKRCPLLGSRFIFLVLAILLALPGRAQTATKPAKKSPKATNAPTWVELGGEKNREIIARQVLAYSGSTPPPCPSVQIPGSTPITMTPRGTPPAGFGKVVLCEAIIPNDTTSASIGAIPLPLPNKTISNIVLIGDTGCKGDATNTARKVAPMEEPDEEEDAQEEAADKASANSSADKTKTMPLKKLTIPQDCAKTSDWPFSQVSKHAAKQKPDLVIHVGDYVYVQGETWVEWYSQFFKPAHDLLLAAPWIFVRGNHEVCSKKFHGSGFFYLLDPRSGTTCPTDNPDGTDPYLVQTGGSQLVVMDSSGATCDFAPNEPGADKKPCSDFDTEVAAWTTLFTKTGQLLASGNSSNAFLLTHRPLWGIKVPAGKNPAGFCPAPAKKKKKTVLVAINSTMQAGYEASKISGIKMILSGHIHNFQLVTYSPQNPGVSPQPQLVVGDSGVELSTPPLPEFGGCKLTAYKQPLDLSTFRGMQTFGFGVLKGDGSQFDLYLRKGEHALKCDITPNQAKCKTEPVTVEPAKSKKK